MIEEPNIRAELVEMKRLGDEYASRSQEVESAKAALEQALEDHAERLDELRVKLRLLRGAVSKELNRVTAGGWGHRD